MACILQVIALVEPPKAYPLRSDGSAADQPTAMTGQEGDLHQTGIIVLWRQAALLAEAALLDLTGSPSLVIESILPPVEELLVVVDTPTESLVNIPEYLGDGSTMFLSYHYL